MSEFISVPRAMVEKHLHEALYAETVCVHGTVTEPYLREDWGSYNFETFKFHAVYELQPESYIDRILRRRRYNLVFVHNHVLGSQGELPSQVALLSKVKYFTSLNVDFSYSHYRTWIK